jgi:DNA polymerase
MLKATENLIPWIKDIDDESWDTIGVARKPTSTKMIAEQCRKSRIPCPPVKSHFDDGDERYEKWVNAYIKTNPWIAALTTWRSIGKVHKTFLKMKGRLFGDTMPFGLKFWGAHTGRWSGDAGLNMQNLRRDPILADENSLMVTNEAVLQTAYQHFEKLGVWPEWVRFIIDIRKLIIPREGKKMIICDLSQIEARVTRWFAGDHAMLDMIRGGLSIYEAHARTYGGWTEGPGVLKKNKDLYALYKARELALGFGCGPDKFITMAKTLAGLDITKDDPEWIENHNSMTGKVTKVSGYGRRSKLEVADYRAKNLGVVNFWNQLNDGLRRSVGEDMELALPSGRSLNYYGVRRSMKIVKNEEGKPEKRWEITAEVGGDREHYYGGKLAENMVQATARDVFGEHLLALGDADMDVLFTAHDEAVLEVDLDRTTGDVEQLMSRAPDWLPGCPIGCEAQEVSHYKK